MNTPVDRKAVPRLTGFGDMRFSGPETVETASGIPLKVLRNDSSDAVRLSVIWRCGTITAENYEAVLIMPMLLEDGTTSVGGDEITEILDFNGASFTAQAGTYSTRAVLTAISGNYVGLLPLVRDMIANPSFPEELLRRKAQSVRTRIAVNRTKLSNIAQINNRIQLWGENNPLSRIVDLDRLGSITRDEILRTHNEIMNMRPEVWVAGNLDDGLISATVSFVDSLPFNGENAGIKERDIFVPEPPSFKEIEAEGKSQSYILATLPAILPENPDFYSLTMAVTHLGGYFGSRLNKNIREEKGLTYGIGCTMNISNGVSTISISCQTLSGNEDTIVSEIKREMRRLAENPPSRSEMRAASLSVEGDLAAILDSVYSMSEMMINNRFNLLPESDFESRLESARNVTSDKIAEMACKYLDPDKLTITVVKGG